MKENFVNPPSSVLGTRRTPVAVLTLYENEESGINKRVIKGKYLYSFDLDFNKPLEEIYHDLDKALPQWLSKNIIDVQSQLGRDFDLSKVGASYSKAGFLEIIAVGKGSLGWFSIEDYAPDDHEVAKSISDTLINLSNASKNPLYKIS